MAATDQNITELPIKTASQVSDEDYMLGIDLVEGYQVSTKDFADYAVNRAPISIGGKTQTTASALSEVRTTASNAQPKVSGKGLSTNDFTNAYKTKLDGIATGAEVNVNADWNATSGDAKILNKPTTVEGYGITDAYTKTEVNEITDTSESESDDSNPITIVTDSAQIAKNTHLTFEPIQDLHGYDHPWPAGGGKNLFGGTYNTLFPLHFDSNTTVTATADTRGGDGKIRVYFYDENEQQIDWWGMALGTGALTGRDYKTFEYPSTAYYVKFSGTESTNYQIEVNSTATAYEPYSNICPITGVDEVEVKRTGKNLLDPNGWKTGYSINANTGEYASNGTFKSSNEFIRVKPNTQYSLIVNKNDGSQSAGTFIAEYDKDEKFIRRLEVISGQPKTGDEYGTWTTSAQTAFVKEMVFVNVTNLQLAVGNDQTYEPYTEQTVTESLPTTVYGGTLDLETGELVVDMGMVDLGSLTWLNNKYGQNAYEFYSSNSLVKLNTTNLLSNVLVQKSSFVDVAEYTIRMGNDFLAVKVPKSVANNSVNMKQWLTDNNVVLCYELATPITYTLTPKQLSLLKGTNHISTNAKSVKVTFRAGQLATLEDVAGAVKIADEHLEEKIADVLNVLAQIDNGETASKAYSVGEYFMHDGQFCKAKTNIASGATFTLNTNYEVTTVGAEIYTALHS